MTNFEEHKSMSKREKVSMDSMLKVLEKKHDELENKIKVMEKERKTMKIKCDKMLFEKEFLVHHSHIMSAEQRCKYNEKEHVGTDLELDIESRCETHENQSKTADEENTQNNKPDIEQIRKDLMMKLVACNTELWNDLKDHDEHGYRNKIKWYVKYERLNLASMKEMVEISQDVRCLEYMYFKLGWMIDNYENFCHEGVVGVKKKPREIL